MKEDSTKTYIVAPMFHDGMISNLNGIYLIFTGYSFSLIMQLPLCDGTLFRHSYYIYTMN